MNYHMDPHLILIVKPRFGKLEFDSLVSKQIQV